MSRTVRFWLIAVVGLVVAAGATFGAFALFEVQAGGSTDPAIRINVLRSALTVGAGTGGAIALLLAFRRQWHTEHDSAQTQILELHSRAMEQLASVKAPVRIGAMYSLERLANSHKDLRQVVINELCAYLRMPSPDLDAIETEREKGEDEERYWAALEERQVRLTAQRILESHLRKGPKYWEHDSLNLERAVLVNADFYDSTLAGANFNQTHFRGVARFHNTVFPDGIQLQDARFEKTALFSGTTFGGDADFYAASIRGNLHLQNARVTSGSVDVSGPGWRTTLLPEDPKPNLVVRDES
ncbi:MAG: pentapeptide repeat-containing protein [Stackebrandtia sp.]